MAPACHGAVWQSTVVATPTAAAVDAWGVVQCSMMPWQRGLTVTDATVLRGWDDVVATLTPVVVDTQGAVQRDMMLW